MCMRWTILITLIALVSGGCSSMGRTPKLGTEKSFDGLTKVENARFGAAWVRTDFDLSGFRHRAVYNRTEGRIETWLDSTRVQTVHFPGGEKIQLAAGEAIRSEISCKYDRPTIDELFRRAGLSVVRWSEDDDGYYALVLAVPTT